MTNLKLFCFSFTFIFAAFSLKAQMITTFAGNGTIGSFGNGVPATSAQLYNPQGICADKHGNIYIADHENHIVRKVNAAGIISTVAGNGTDGYSGDGGLAADAQLKYPYSVCIDNQDNLYISDDGAHVIRKINTGGIISTFAGNGTSHYSGDGGPAILAGLFAPCDICADNAGNIYIVDFASNVRKIAPDGIISVVAGTIFSNGYFGDNGPATQAQLNSPVSIACDNKGNLYISDMGNGVIRKINNAGIITTIAGGGLGYVDGGPATATALNSPFGVFVDASGNVYIGDTGNGVIRKVATNGIITTIAGNGTHGYSGDGGPAIAGQLNTPGDLCMDSEGNIYVVDAGNFVVRKISNVTSCNSEYFLKTYLSDTLSVNMKDAVMAAGDEQIIAGSLPNPNTPANVSDAVILKLGSKGEKLWEKNFVEPGEQMLYKIIALKDGNYLAAGTGSDVNAYYCFLMKFDANGNVIWKRNHQFKNIPISLLIFRGLAEAEDGSIILTGNFDESGSPRLLYMKFSSDGSLVLSKSIHPPSWAIITGSMGMVIKDGYSYVTGVNLNFYFWSGLLLKINNANGNIEWTKQYESGNSDVKLNQVFLLNNQLCLLGSTSTVQGDTTVVMVIDTSGAAVNNAKYFYYRGFGASLKSIVKRNNNILLFPANGQRLVVSEVSLQSGVLSAEKNNLPNDHLLVLNAFESAGGSVYISGLNVSPDGFRGILYSAAVKANGSFPCPATPVNAAFGNGTIVPGPIEFFSSNIEMQEITVSENDGTPKINIIDTLCREVITCSSLTLKAPATICFTDTLMITVNKDCNILPVYQYDSAQLRLISISDTAIKFELLKAGITKIRASINTGCLLLEDSVNVGITQSAGAMHLGSDTSICAGTSLLLNAHTGYSAYRWQDGSTDSTFIVSMPGSYQVTVSGACGNPFSDTINVSRLIVTVDIGPERIKCNNDILHLNASVGFINYNWGNNYNINSLTGQSVIINPVTDTAYFIKAEKTPGCFAYDTVKILVRHSNPIDLGPDNSFCSGDSAVFDAGNGFDQYNWSNGQTTRNITVFSPASYYIAAITADGCRSYDTVKVVDVFALPGVNLNSSTSLCTGETRTLDAGNFPSYLWSNGSTGKSIEVNTIGSYSVNVTDSNGCKGSAAVNITTLLKLPGNFLPTDTAVCFFKEMLLQPSGSYRQYLWSNGLVSPSVNVYQPGIYWLTVTDVNNCRGTDTISISTKECARGFYIPSAFTPNNDGKNDVFKPILFGNVKRYSFTIYNRFGQIVFQTNDVSKGWDGKFKNKDQNGEAFVWTCNYQLEGEIQKLKKGNVLVIK